MRERIQGRIHGRIGARIEDAGTASDTKGQSVAGQRSFWCWTPKDLRELQRSLHFQLQRGSLDPSLRQEEEVFAALQAAATGRNVLLILGCSE